jgi:hypothetical protein
MIFDTVIPHRLDERIRYSPFPDHTSAVSVGGALHLVLISGWTEGSELLDMQPGMGYTLDLAMVIEWYYRHSRHEVGRCH